MKFSTKLLSAAVLMASSTIGMAQVSTSTSVEINVTKSEFVNILGTITSASNSVRNLSDAAVDNQLVSLGTMGAETNVPGGCAVTFDSLNGNRLLLAGSTTEFLHGSAGTYSVVHANDYSTECDQTAADLSLQFPALPSANTILAGVYSDLLTITVTTQ